MNALQYRANMYGGNGYVGVCGTTCLLINLQFRVPRNMQRMVTDHGTQIIGARSRWSASGMDEQNWMHIARKE